jgi:hypothetical protein
MFSGFVVLLIFGFTLTGLLLAAALYGMGDGFKTIARGTLPLALFDAKGCGARLGWISLVQMGINPSSCCGKSGLALTTICPRHPWRN